MTDRPILFSAPMVRAILDGRKTQTRRILSRSNTLFDGRAWPSGLAFDDCRWNGAFVDPGPSPAGNSGPYLKVEWPYGRIYGDGDDEMLMARVYPRIQPGDRLWVREAFCVDDCLDDLPPRSFAAGHAIPYAPGRAAWGQRCRHWCPGAPRCEE